MNIKRMILGVNTKRLDIIVWGEGTAIRSVFNILPNQASEGLKL